MSNYKSTAAEKAAVNERMPCSVTGCEKYRAGLSRYCEAHKRRHKTYGSPTGTSLYTSGGGRVYAGTLQAVHELLVSHAGSEPVQVSLRLLTDWFDAAKAGADVPGSRLLTRIKQGKNSITYMHVLEELTAAFIHVLMRTSFNITEMRYVMGNAVIRLVRKEWRTVVTKSGRTIRKNTTYISSKEREAIGQYVLDEIGPFLANAYSHYKLLRESENNIKASMTKPI